MKGINKFLFWLKRRKILFQIKNYVEHRTSEKVFLESYGAVNIDPSNWVVWICVESDIEKERLSTEKSKNTYFKEILKNSRYPYSAIDSVQINYESEETVKRESDGNWFVHFK